MGKIHEEANRLLLILYSAPGNVGAWTEFLAQFSDASGAVQGLLVYHDEGKHQTKINSSYGLEAEFADLYDSYFQYTNPYIEFPELLFPLPGTFGLLNDIIPDKKVMKTEFFNDYVVPQGVTVENGIRLTPLMSENVFTTIALHKPKGAVGDPEHGIQLCKLLMPHLQTAMSLQHRINGLEADLGRMSALLDNVSFGVAFFDGTGRCLVVNAAARTAFNARDGLNLIQGRISTAIASQAVSISRMLNNARMVGNGESIDPIGLIRLSRPSGKRSYEVLVTPIFESGTEALVRNASTAVYIFDPEAEGESLEFVMAQLYQLTAKEVEVLKLIMQGHTAAQVSDQLCKSRETVKNQLRSIFRKTDTCRQSELISAVLKGVAMMKRPSG